MSGFRNGAVGSKKQGSGRIVGNPETIHKTAFSEITGDVRYPDFWTGIISGYAVARS
jgi:hypothetical protein